MPCVSLLLENFITFITFIINDQPPYASFSLYMYKKKVMFEKKSCNGQSFQVAVMKICTLKNLLEWLEIDLIVEWPNLLSFHDKYSYLKLENLRMWLPVIRCIFGLSFLQIIFKIIFWKIENNILMFFKYYFFVFSNLF